MRLERMIAYFSLAMSILFFLTSYASADFIDSIQIRKISPKDQMAIIKTSDGEMQIINIGTILPPSQSGAADAPKNPETLGSPRISPRRFKVIEIAAGRVVLESMDEAMETIIIRLEKRKQKIERIKKTTGKQPVFFKTE